MSQIIDHLPHVAILLVIIGFVVSDLIKLTRK